MARTNPALVQTIHDSLAQYARENYEKFYYLVYSYVKNQEVATLVIQNVVYYSLANARKLPELPPMRTWYFQLLIRDGMRTMRRNDFPRKFTDNSQLYAYFETLEPSATNVFKLYYFEEMEMDQVMGILRMKADEVKRRLRYVRSAMEIDSSLDEESLERLEELIRLYESPEIPEDLGRIVEEAIRKEEEGHARHMEKQRKTRIIKPLGLVVLIVLLFLFTGHAVETQPGFAEALARVPLIGNLLLSLF
ncbi:MAG: hypothetical protein Q4C22_00695 [Bacillota bacterium]|nr:hypothetical protein [Bacillota bacterium]